MAKLSNNHRVKVDLSGSEIRMFLVCVKEASKEALIKDQKQKYNQLGRLEDKLERALNPCST